MMTTMKMTKMMMERKMMVEATLLINYGENPFFDSPMDMVRTGYGTVKDALDPNK
jgi:hypothetical protein